MKSTLLFLLVAVLPPDSKQVCIPCPGQRATLKSFINCTCSPHKFHDELSQKCVNPSECPLSFDPSPEIRASTPSVINDALSKLPRTKDIPLTMKALKMRLEDFKLNFMSVISPVIIPLLINNEDLLEKCKGQVQCTMFESLKRLENFKLIAPKIPEIAQKEYGRFLGIFDDLKKLEDDMCKTPEDCVVVRRLIDLQEEFPSNISRLKDFMKIMELADSLLTDAK